MIKRVYIKELLSFDEIELELDRGLIVITGPSGSGKSVLIGAILANFGLNNQEAKLCEIEIEDANIKESDEFELDSEIIIKSIKKDRIRYFINSQNISKKALKELFRDYVSYISVRDKSGFENEKILSILDSYAKHNDLIREYQEKFRVYKKSSQELKALKEKIEESNERIEFLKYEIEKIESINPKEGEYEELLKIKKQLSKLEKIEELADSANRVFELEDDIYELFNLLDKDSTYLSEAFNQLRSDLDDIEVLKEELSEVDIESILDRLEDLNYLIKRFGTIAEAIAYLDSKREELKSFERIDEDLSHLEEKNRILKEELLNLANKISLNRKDVAKRASKDLYSYLKELKLGKPEFVFSQKELDIDGVDIVEIKLDNIKVDKLSGGEFNRVRLALLTIGASIANDEGIIILDEIDANVSGDESIAIANMISELSKSFQIFAISHQPHLSTKANTHILVTKKDNKSLATILNQEERIKEIARIIGGESFNKEALEFAQRILNDN